MPDGRILSWSNDKTLRLSDGQSGAPLAVLDGHAEAITGVQLLTDGRILSWSYDNTLRLWDGVTGDCLLTCNVESDDFTAAWQEQLTPIAAVSCGSWWVQAFERRISIADTGRKDKARWHGQHQTRLVHVDVALVAAVVGDTLTFLQIHRGAGRIQLTG